MRNLLWLIGLFALAVGVALLAGVNTGYVLVVVPPYRVQLSLNLLIFLLASGFAVAYFFLRLVGRTLELPSRVTAFRDRRRRERADRSLRDAVRVYLEGRYAQALKLADTAFAAREGRGVAALLAARAAHAIGDEERYRAWLAKAADSGDEVRVARLMTEAEMALTGHRFDEAADRLDVLATTGGRRHIAALRLSLRAAQARGEWEDALRLARQLLKHKALSPDQAEPLIRRAHLEWLRRHDHDPEGLARYWKRLPTEELRDRRFVEKAVPLLRAGGQCSLARQALEDLLDKDWDSALARLYGVCSEDDPVACLARAERWLTRHPRDAGLLFALGQLCFQNQLWGKAQSYLEASSSLAPSVETHLALAQLAERLERAEEAQEHYRAAAEMAAG
jgi:HemY protein